MNAPRRSGFFANSGKNTPSGIARRKIPVSRKDFYVFSVRVAQVAHVCFRTGHEMHTKVLHVDLKFQLPLGHTKGHMFCKIHILFLSEILLF